MGFSLADCARLMGGEVILIHGPVSINPPYGINEICVISAHEMNQRVMEHFDNVDVVIMTAAISDYTPSVVSEHKIKKSHTSSKLTLKLKRTKDILMELGNRKKNQYLVGFALETEKLVENTKLKLKTKKLDMIVANPLTEFTGFDTPNNSGVMLFADGSSYELPLMSKRRMAMEILFKIGEKIKG